MSITTVETVHGTLWVRGDETLLRRDPGVAVVGARACTAYGSHVAGQIGSTLASHDVITVSSGAFGIDSAAHRGALAAGGATIVVLACGVDQAYPSAHAQLFDTIVNSGGLLVSAYPPGTTPNRQRFLERNGLIAALSRSMVVVEASVRSGSLSAARQAWDQGGPVYAVPGPVTSMVSTGTNALIKDGYAMILPDPCDLTDVIEAGWMW